MLRPTAAAPLLALFLLLLLAPSSSHQQETSQKSPTGGDQNAGVDDILKDTFQLLDQLDQKLAQVKNKTPSAMMRDNLRALEGDDGGELAAAASNKHGASSAPDEEASVEEALLRLADGFSSGRQLVGGGEPMTAAASGHEEQVVVAAPPPSTGEQRKKGARQLNQAAAPVTPPHANQILSAASDEQQLVASDSTERHIKFTLDLMHSIFFSQSHSAKSQPLVDSFLISPLSIQMVLMMMHLGARGSTRREIGQCLHLASDQPKPAHHPQAPQANELAMAPSEPTKLRRRHQQQQLSPNQPKTMQQAAIRQQPAVSAAVNPHELFGGAVRNLLKDPAVTKALTSANQIFLQRNLPLSSQYESAIRHYYAADVKLVDFQHQRAPQASSAASPLPPTSASPSSSSASSPAAASSSSASAGAPLAGKLEPAPSASNASQQQQQEPQNNVQQMINEWVERQTKGRISNFLSAPISSSTLMMAINVLYFKGDWQYKFDPSDTQPDAVFTQANGKTQRLPMMVGRLPLAFAHDPVMKTSVIELPYKAQRLGLFLLLPDEVSGIFHTMQTLNSTSFANLIASMRKPPASLLDQPGANGVNVRIPKFSIESSPRLSHILAHQLGLKKLFSPDMADLSGMFAPHPPSANSKLQNRHPTTNSSSPQGGEPAASNPQVGLDELLHKAVLQVDEQGSVAAASSATVIERVGLFNSNYFEADHPFLLFLMDKQTGLVLFSGAFAGNNNNSSSEAQQQH